MKTNVSAPVAIITIIVIIGAIGFLFLKKGQPGSLEGQQPPGMPPAVAAEMQKRMGGPSGTTMPAPAPGANKTPGAQAGQTAPTNPTAP